MATQTGSIDLASTSAVKLYAEAGFESAEQTYATKGELEVTNEAVALRATKEEAYQVARPNLAPISAAPMTSIYNATTNPNGYWKGNFSTWATNLEDGWVHVYYDNSANTKAVSATTWRPRPAEGIVPGGVYTILTEIRNNHSTVSTVGSYDIYLQQMADNQFWGNVEQTVPGSPDNGTSTTTTINLGRCGESYVLRSYRLADVEHLTGEPTELFRYNFRLPAGMTFDFDMRQSIYEGIYDGPYKPYAGPQLFATQAELKVTADGISSEVSKKTDKDTIISTINQSAEEIQIQASKVAIDGTAIFSAIQDDVDDAITDKGYQTSSQVESAITSKGYATTTQAQGYATTAKGEAISAAATDATTKADAAQTAATTAANEATDTKLLSYSTTQEMNTAIGDAVDEIEVGGTNLLRRTGMLVTNDVTITRSSVPNVGIIRLTPTGSAAYSMVKVDYLDFEEYGEGTYTISFDARLADVASSYTATNVLCYLGFNAPSNMGKQLNSSYDRYTPARTLSTSLTETWRRLSTTVKVPEDVTTGQASALAAGSMMVVQVGASGSRKPIEIRHIKLEKGNKETPWSPAPEDSILSDSRNLLLDTEHLDSEKWTTYDRGTVTSGQSDPDGGTDAFLVTPSSDDWFLAGDKVRNYSLSDTGDWYTFSVWLRADNATTANICMRYVISDLPYTSNASRKTIEVTTEWQRFWLSGVLNAAVQNDYTVWVGQLTTEPVYFYHPKLEKGDRPTPWSPAPEDVANDISSVKTTADAAAPKANAVKRTQRIYYRSSSSTKPTAMPTAWVAETGNKWAANATTAANWSTKVTPIANGTGASVTKYLYLWTCEQREMADGTLAYTNVLLDDSTTVIDGGKLITNSVTANEIDATGLHVAAANVDGKLTASQIQVDSISVGDLSDGDDYATKTEARGYADDIQVGGRNLLPDTEAWGPRLWDSTGSLHGSDGATISDGILSYSANTTGNSMVGVQVEAGVKYTLSVDVRSDTAYTYDTDGNQMVLLDYSDTEAYHRTSYAWCLKGAKLATEWARISETFTVPDNAAYLFIRLRNVASNPPTYQMRRMKLERGNKPTDWTPAPEDETTARRAIYGTCSTAAGTAAKVVACEGFELVTGARITIKFTTANTAAAPTLNVNGTGAVAVWYNNVVAAAANPVLWGANATLSFVYDGTHWVLETKPPVYSVACSTAAGTRAKAATVAGALVVNGTTVQVLFSTANTYVANSVQFNFSGTAAANIYRDRAATSASHTLTWEANTVLTLVRNAQYWYLADNGTRTMSEEAAQTATNYISADSTGIRIASSNPATATTYQHQTATETEFVVGGTSMAEFGGSGSRMGSTAGSHVTVDDDSVDFMDGTSVVGSIRTGTDPIDKQTFMAFEMGEHVDTERADYFEGNAGLYSRTGSHPLFDGGESTSLSINSATAEGSAKSQIRLVSDYYNDGEDMVTDTTYMDVVTDLLHLATTTSEDGGYLAIGMVDVIRALSYQTYPLTMHDSGATSHSYLIVSGGIAHCYFQGGTNTRGAGHQLFTVPAACLPKDEVHIPFVINSNAYGHAVLNQTTGLCSISQVSAQVSGRLYLNATWLVV